MSEVGKNLSPLSLLVTRCWVALSSFYDAIPLLIFALETTTLRGLESFVLMILCYLVLGFMVFWVFFATASGNGFRATS
jgi:hypothetical protein